MVQTIASLVSLPEVRKHTSVVLAEHVIRNVIKLSCDGMDKRGEACEDVAEYEGAGDNPRHLASAAGWRWTHTGRCLCRDHARYEWPASFVLTNTHEFPDYEMEISDEALLA